jgi:hypothetical protein
MVGDLVEKERLPKLGEEGFIKLNLEKVGNMSANGYFHPFLGRQRFCCFRYTENGNCDSNNGAWSWNYHFYDNNSGVYHCNHSFAGNQYGFNGYVYTHNKVYGSTNPYLGNANMGIYLTDDGGTPGFYLCVLATEYAMLKNSFHESRATAEELWQVLNLFDRLDYMGEVVFGKPPKVDGFFIRNDIPEDFLRNGEFGKNYTLTTNLYAGGPWKDGSNGFVNRLNSCPDQSDWDCDYGAGLNRNLFTNESKRFKEFVMSQDQSIRWLLGLAMVIKQCPDDSNFPFRTKAQEVMERLIRYISDGFYNYHGGDRVSNRWVIIQPDGNHVCLGADARSFSFYLATIGKKLTGKNYHNAVSLTTGLTSAMGIKLLYLPLLTNALPAKPFATDFNFLLIDMLGAMSKLDIKFFDPSTWSRALWSLPHKSIAKRSFANFLYNLERAGNQCDKRNNSFTIEPSLDLYTSILNNEAPYYPPQLYRDILVNDCFKCHTTLHDDCSEESSGVNYMMLFTHFSEVFLPHEVNLGGQNKYFEEGKLPYLLDRKLSFRVPYYVKQNAPIGNASNKLTIQAARSLKLTNKILSDGFCDFYAPHILLEPGFSASFGSKVFIENNRANCGIINSTGVSQQPFAYKTDNKPDTENSTYQLKNEYVPDSTFLKKLFENFKLSDWIRDEEIDALSEEDKQFILSYWGVNKNSDDFSFNASVFPNPSNGLFKIQVNTKQNGELDFQLFDVNGKEVRQQNLGYIEKTKSNEFEIDFSNLSKGIYLLRLQQEKIYIKNFRIIIQ